MRIGVLADTHLPAGGTLPRFVWDTLDGVELILHAGDVVSPDVLNDLASLAPVQAVRGNCDGWELAHLPDIKLVTCEGKRLGLVHGYQGSGPTPERAWRAFRNESPDVVIFGHSHLPYLEWRDGVLLFNPGSPTDKRRQAHYSLGILEITLGQIRARHYYF